jgi:uncharacterized membrane protein
MEFEEFFENKRKNHGNYMRARYHDDKRKSHEMTYSFPGHYKNQQWSTILEKIRSNKKLKTIIIVAGTLIIAMVILLIVVFMPLIINLFTYISQNGLQG